jgi:hypothetical protein
MKSVGLFSHPVESENVAKNRDSEEPVQNPVFSDQPKKDSSIATPSS